MDRVGEEVGADGINTELKRKDQLETPPVCAGLNSDWPESSFHNYTNTIHGNYVGRPVAFPLVGTESPCSVNGNGAAVNELTVGNYRNSSRQGQWQYLHQIASGSGFKPSHGEDMDRVMMRAREQFMKMNYDAHGTNFLTRKRIDKAAEEISPYTRARDNGLSSMGGQLKTLHPSWFSQLFGKKSPKGKGVVGRIADVRRELGSSTAGLMNDEKPDPETKIMSSSLVKSSFVESSIRDGVSLRDWLKPGSERRDKVESMNLFKQIVELVDSAHSQGVILKELRPSYFCLHPSGRVIYTGSYVQRESEYALKHDVSKKRPHEQDIDAHHVLRLKQQKLIDEVKPLTSQPHSISRAKRLNGVENCFSGPRVSSYFEVHTQNHPTYQSTYIATEQLCPSPALLEENWYTSPEELNDLSCSFLSNIYSLGVLLFELLCYFDSSEMHSAAMLDLRQRVLPRIFLSEQHKEAGFCLWLLHPEPSSRPIAREILQSELINVSHVLRSQDELSITATDDEVASELLVDFLGSLKDQKEMRATKLVKDIKSIEEDIKEIFSQRRTCLNGREQDLLFQGPTTAVALSQSRLMRNISQLEDAYFSMRSKIQVKKESDAVGSSDKDLLNCQDRLSDLQNENKQLTTDHKSNSSLGAFFEGLSKFARYSQFELCGTLRNGDLLNSANVICSLSFDRDEEYVAAAGVSKRIKIFEFNTLLNDSVDIHYPVVEMSNKSKLSCVCWNTYIKNYLASTDYDGVVQMWDAGTGQGFSQYKEHQKRAWSVDFSQADPTKFASGSDDCFVKLWSINEKSSTGAIRNPANVCCVQFSAFSSHLMAFGSADYKVYCYDLRNTRIPWCVLAGHEKAVSYVKFLDSKTLVSASTDNTLKLWNLKKCNPDALSPSACSLTYRGHSNEKNFVGLSVMDGYIACGSETNEVYSYYRSLPMPIASYKFGSIDPISGHEIGDETGQFVSSVCYRKKSNMIVAANSSGCIRLLQMV